MVIISKKSITDIPADVIVNASNGIGYMGGVLGKIGIMKGVAESINHATKGESEKAAKKEVKRKPLVPRIFSPIAPGNIFFTEGCGIANIGICHAVTMYYPGMKSSYQYIDILLPKIVEESRKLGATSIVLPLLGCGTGKLRKEVVLNKYKNFLKDFQELEIYISCPQDSFKKLKI